MHPSIPVELIATIFRWPTVSNVDSTLDIAYKSLLAVETRTSDWGVPSWDELSVPQALSAKLVQAILVDHSDIFSNPDVAGQRSMHNLCCWQVISAAAPSLLVCPPMAENQQETSDVLMPPAGSGGRKGAKPHRFQGNIHLQHSCEEKESKFYQEMQETKSTSWDHLSWVLRGCLIVFCPRLDKPEYVRAEVVSTVAALKRSPTGKSVAVVYSSKHVIAVALDDTVVRHTPPLLVHDLKLNIQSGALLLGHLLDAQIGNKTFQGLS
ncbi:hypothetical protein FRC07_006265 [Ceratobasidium sp. 392]|nr:hypothetical protein FRC07_006265 [Ceratobasidium sp. 392]